jgi:predicted lipoprotein with Yx(FWY)xxD motif
MSEEVLNMVKVATARGGAVLWALLFTAFLLSFFVVRAADASPSAGVRVVATAKNPTLKKTILGTRRGLTLYSLSVERRGKFICTDSQCLSFWHPLVIAKGAKPLGAPKLGTVKRPDGRTQVTYRGGPLYTFYLDRKRGDVKGEGFKDVGVWHAASPSTKTTTTTPPPPYGGGYGGGYR